MIKIHSNISIMTASVNGLYKLSDMPSVKDMWRHTESKRLWKNRPAR